jgi:hypothetical protein
MGVYFLSFIVLNTLIKNIKNLKFLHIIKRFHEVAFIDFVDSERLLRIMMNEIPTGLSQPKCNKYIQ